MKKIITLLLFLIFPVVLVWAEETPGLTSDETIRKKYDKNKLLQTEISYKDYKIQWWKRYYPTGKVKQEFPFSNGKIEGTVKSYYESGKLKVESPYVAGKPDGVSKEYDEEGKLRQEILYGNGQMTQKTLYESDGKIAKTEEYKQ